MSTYIHHEEEAQGDEYWDEEEALEYETTSISHEHLPNGAISSPSCYIPADIQGTEYTLRDGSTLKDNLTRVCTERQSVFNTKVSPEPAYVTPLKLEVDNDAWRCKANQANVRIHSLTKQAEVSKQIAKMIPLGVIKRSQAPYFSPVHLTPKPIPGEWRFCLDYRRLNAATKPNGWPIPNIADMLRRLGDKKAKFFCKLDLTSGYHQAPLHPDSQEYTAFRSMDGIHQWNRVPMGLRGAPSYFQQVMTIEVLRELLYSICEIYIDDIIIFASNEEEMIERLNTVLQRLQEHNVTVNPDKCSFGITQVEFVGHTVDRDGLHFSREKLDKVLMVELPKTGKQLKSFLGVCVYFCDHVYHYSDIVAPLHSMIRKYEPQRTLHWTGETKEAFYALQKAVNECPLVHFQNEKWPVFVASDASDYGIGAICYQMNADKLYPIAFMSKILTAAECKWSTTEKECFAIVYALRKFEYVIRDYKFTLLTDHLNLIYIDNETSQKVKRWKLTIQGFDFDIVHIAGRLNEIADGFSRLLPIPQEHVFWMSDFSIPEEQAATISKFHNSTIGHHGIDRTVRLLTEGGHAWTHLRMHVSRFVKRCACCQKMNHLTPLIAAHRFTMAAPGPFMRINIDRIGPLPESRAGHTSILVIIDCFSRFVTLFPVKDGSAANSKSNLLWHFGQWGVPEEVIHDGGPEFANHEIQELLALCGVINTTTLAYSKEENAMVERANKEVMRHLRNILFETNIVDNWEDHLGAVMSIMNHQRRGNFFPSPVSILFGDVYATSRTLHLNPEDTPEGDAPVVLSEWANRMLAQQQTMFRLATDIQVKQDKEHMAKFGPPQEAFKDGDLVLAKYHSTSGVVQHKGPPNKLMPYLRGPYRVISHDRDDYIIRSLVTHKDMHIHVTLLRLFHYDPEKTDLVAVAVRDHQGENYIDFIRDHVVNPGGRLFFRRDMSFWVRWAGFGPESDTLEPYSGIRDSRQLHAYLLAHPDTRFRSMIPKKFIVHGAYSPDDDKHAAEEDEDA